MLLSADCKNPAKLRLPISGLSPEGVVTLDTNKNVPPFATLVCTLQNWIFFCNLSTPHLPLPHSHGSVITSLYCPWIQKRCWRCIPYLLAWRSSHDCLVVIVLSVHDCRKSLCRFEFAWKSETFVLLWALVCFCIFFPSGFVTISVYHNRMPCLLMLYLETTE